ncbi:bestrophin family protein [Streptacidiphilus sp. EB129]|uniref:bestrophin family protein n=1 Tax=Streptacidiphilus sp. EB129 TaxID=3156262 RepID=UPI0035180020
MIVKGTFNVSSTLPFVRFDLALATVSGTAAYLLVDLADIRWLALPSLLATVLGTALAILLAFRANTAYQRWWEASTIWAQLTGQSRTLIRVARTVTDAKLVDPAIDPATVRAWQHDLANRQAAWAHSLARLLRRQDATIELTRLLSPEEAALVLAADNGPAVLARLQSQAIFHGYDLGILSGLDNFQMETALAGLSTQQALAERMSITPIPRPHDYVSRLFVHCYVVVFPFAVISALTSYRWLVIPSALLIALFFRMVERVGASTEEPFANRSQDVPVTALAVSLERDLLELVDVDERPARPAPVDGYLW